MKILTQIFIYTLVLICSTATLSFAEETAPPIQEEIPETQSDITHFDISLELGTQSAWNNSIPVIIHLTPRQDYEQVEIRGTAPAALEFDYRGNQYFSVNAGETYELTSRVFPQKSGTYRLSVSAIAWQYDTNYSSSEAIELTIDENLHIVPQSDMYIVNVIVRYVVLTIGTIVLGFLAFLGGKKAYARLKVWLLPED